MFRRSSESPLVVENDYIEPDEFEELVEEGSAMLLESPKFILILRCCISENQHQCEVVS